MGFIVVNLKLFMVGFVLKLSFQGGRLLLKDRRGFAPRQAF